MLGMSALKDLLSKQRITSDFQPGEILDPLRKFMLTSLAEADESDDTTVSDPFKDTSGPSLNILIKLMSMVSVVVAGLTLVFSLF